MIDSHCHLDHEPLFTRLNEILDRSKKIGITKLLTICTSIKSFESILTIIKEDPMIYGTYGIHPHEAKNHISIKSEDIIYKIKLNKKIIGIGESGLDFYYNHSDRKDQIKCFEEHIIGFDFTPSNILPNFTINTGEVFLSDILTHPI